MAKVLSENAAKVLSFLQANASADLTADAIAEALGMAPRSVNGTVTGLQKKGLVVRQEVEGFDKKVVRLTGEGAGFDPDMEKAE